MACSGSVALMLYPKLLKLQNKYPNIHINLKAAPNNQILSDVKNGTVDQGIVTDKPNDSLFDCEELGREELCLIVPKQAKVNKSWQQKLLGLGLISHPDAEHYLSLYFKQCEEPELHGLDIAKVPIIGSINQISQILEPLIHGVGFTILPKSAVDSFHRAELLKIMQPQQPVMERLYLVRKKNRKLPARYNAFNSIVWQAWA